MEKWLRSVGLVRTARTTEEPWTPEAPRTTRSFFPLMLGYARSASRQVEIGGSGVWRSCGCLITSCVAQAVWSWSWKIGRESEGVDFDVKVSLRSTLVLGC